MSSESVASVGHRQQPLRQRPSAYGRSDHSVWSALYCRRLVSLRTDAAAAVLRGLDDLDIGAGRIPSFRHINRRLVPRSGWAIVPGEPFRPPTQVARMLSRRRLPSAVTIRPSACVEHPAAPDIFSDLLGRVPLLTDRRYAEYLERAGAALLGARSPAAQQGLARLLAYTVEFGLIDDPAGIRVYGSELVPSAGLSRHALGAGCRRRPFGLAVVLATPLPGDRLPDLLFVTEDFDQLHGAVDHLASLG